MANFKLCIIFFNKRMYPDWSIPLYFGKSKCVMTRYRSICESSELGFKE